jgi:hypothetical protein
MPSVFAPTASDAQYVACFQDFAASVEQPTSQHPALEHMAGGQALAKAHHPTKRCDRRTLIHTQARQTATVTHTRFICRKKKQQN